MTIEATLNEIVTTLKAIHTALASGAAVAPTATTPTATPTATPAAAPAAEKPKAEPTKPKAEPTKPKAEPAAKGADWKTDVMPVLLEINKSTKPEHGRAGLLNVMSKFGLPDGSKVPDLEKLGKHAEVLAYAKSVLAGESTTPAEAEDDFGLGI